MKNLITLTTTFLALVLAANTYASDYKKPYATGESYFDVITGHRYIKNFDATYREYTKKGEIFRESVPADLALLTANKYIREIGRNCFVMYEKIDQNIIKTQILPASCKHPNGWRAKTAIICPKGNPEKMVSNSVIAYSTSQTSDLGTKKRVATGESYIDVATGHRYIKNSDATYREYTKRGELFRTSVSADLPLLTTNRNIKEIGQTCYLLYRRNKNHRTEILVLPPDQEHPVGWSIENMLVSMNL